MRSKSTERAIADLIRRSYWYERDARVVVDAWRRSGVSQREFARRHALDARRLARWIKRLAGTDRASRRVQRSAAVVRFHPVRVVEQITGSNGSLGESHGVGASRPIEIVLGDGRTIRVPAGFAGGDLARVLALVDSHAGAGGRQEG